jgi:large subunit ribosomal protein L6
MSRVGKKPVAIPQGVSVTVTADHISVKGSLGTLERQINSLVSIKSEGGVLSVVPNDASTAAGAMSGVSKGFERKLNLVGVGYRAQAVGQKLNLQIGFSHPVVKDMPAGIKVECATQTEILIKGTDRQVVGQIAAEVRAFRPPEPYKGKGIRYSDEKVSLKETKKK